MGFIAGDSTKGGTALDAWVLICFSVSEGVWESVGEAWKVSRGDQVAAPV